MFFRSRAGRRANSTLEFTLVGIPLIFTLISVEEISRGMWIYTTLASTVARTARYISVRGKDCACLTLGQIATQITQTGTGLDAAQLQLTLTGASGSTSCNPLNTCSSSATAWPSASDGTPGNNIQLKAVLPFKSALVMFWPGVQPTSIGTVNLNATSTQQIEY